MHRILFGLHYYVLGMLLGLRCACLGAERERDLVHCKYTHSHAHTHTLTHTQQDLSENQITLIMTLLLIMSLTARALQKTQALLRSLSVNIQLLNSLTFNALTRACPLRLLEIR